MRSIAKANTSVDTCPRRSTSRSMIATTTFFLAPCSVHRLTGHDASCLNCTSAVLPGIFAVKPLTRTFKYYYDPENKTKYVNIQRKQFPLTPALAMPLYSMQGTTAEPGMVAYWFFPQRCSPTVKWLIAASSSKGHQRSWLLPSTSSSMERSRKPSLPLLKLQSAMDCCLDCLSEPPLAQQC